MKTLLFAFLLIGANTFGQVTQDDLNIIWEENVDAIVRMDRDVIDQFVIHAPEGEWGYIVGLEGSSDEWTKEQFMDNLESIFSDDLRLEFRMGDVDMLEVVQEDAPSIVHLTHFTSEEYEGEIYESATIIVFEKLDGQWFLTRIMLAG